MRWLVVGALAVAALFGARSAWHRHEDAALRSVVRSFPLPAGYRRADLQMEGGGCDINFGCARRLAAQAIVKEDDGFPMCPEVVSSLQRWKGFVLERDEPRSTCDYFGSLRGRPIEVRISQTWPGGPAIVIYASGSTLR